VFFKKQPKPAGSNKRSLIIFAILVIVYIGLNNSGRREFKPEIDGKPAQSGLQQALSDSKNALLNLRGLNVMVKVEGAGAGAVCGQDVRILYTVKDADGNQLEANDDFSGKIGKTKLIKAIDMGLFNKKSGSEIEIESPSYLAYDVEGFTKPEIKQNTPVRVNLKVLELKPALPASEMGVRSFDTASSAQVNLKGAECGEKIDLQLVLWSADGAQIITDKTFSVQSGSGEYPMWLESSSVGLASGVIRTVIIPPVYSQFSFSGKTEEAEKIGITKPQMLIADLRRL